MDLSDWPLIAGPCGLFLIWNPIIRQWPLEDGVSRTDSLRQWSRRLFEPTWLMSVGLPIYLIHQFEEHGYDLTGKKYAFVNWWCESMGFGITDCPMTVTACLVVNIAIVIMGYYARSRPNITVNYYGFMFVNGLVHVFISVRDGLVYNPGLGTTLMFFWPASYLAFKQFGHAKRGLALGVLAHVIIMVGYSLAAKGVVSNGGNCLIQIMNILPILLLGNTDEALDSAKFARLNDN